MHASRLVCIIYVGILMFYITLSIHNTCNHEYPVGEDTPVISCAFKLMLETVVRMV